jgi:hypothetical protein
MSYKLKFPEKDVLGMGKFKNATGKTECVEFVRQASGAPQTPLWKKGKKVPEALGESGTRPLDKVVVYLSHPTQNGALVPDSTKRTKTEERVTWRLVRGPSDEFWVGCTYHGTTAIMAKRLGQDVRQCVASYQLLPSGSRLRLIGMSCKRL